MAKWIIPRHKPKRATEDMMSDINHGKRFKRKALARINREGKRKADEYRAYKALADDGLDVARLVLGSCTRKRSLPLHVAKRCANAVWLESWRRAFVYACPYCGKYHITTHPESQGKYVYDTDQFGKTRRGTR